MLFAMCYDVFILGGIGDMGGDAGIATALRAGPPLRFGSGFAASGPRVGAGMQVTVLGLGFRVAVHGC